MGGYAGLSFASRFVMTRLQEGPIRGGGMDLILPPGHGIQPKWPAACCGEEWLERLTAVSRSGSAKRSCAAQPAQQRAGKAPQLAPGLFTPEAGGLLASKLLRCAVFL